MDKSETPKACCDACEDNNRILKKFETLMDGLMQHPMVGTMLAPPPVSPFQLRR